MGCLWPVFSILFSDIIAVMLENDSDQVSDICGYLVGESGHEIEERFQPIR